MKYVADIYDLKVAEGITRKIPQFNQIRKTMYKDFCPPISMTFVFLNKADGSIISVHEDHTPLARFQRDPQYQKLYEEAHIQVIHIHIIMSNSQGIKFFISFNGKMRACSNLKTLLSFIYPTVFLLYISRLRISKKYITQFVPNMNKMNQSYNFPLTEFQNVRVPLLHWIHIL